MITSTNATHPTISKEQWNFDISVVYAMFFFFRSGSALTFKLFSVFIDLGLELKIYNPIWSYRIIIDRDPGVRVAKSLRTS